jgi:hypothetical protein
MIGNQGDGEDDFGNFPKHTEYLGGSPGRWGDRRESSLHITTPKCKLVTC